MNFLSRHSGAGRNPANQIRREAAQQSGVVRYAGCVITGFRPDGTASHSTKLANSASQVAGYAPE